MALLFKNQLQFFEIGATGNNQRHPHCMKDSVHQRFLRQVKPGGIERPRNKPKNTVDYKQYKQLRERR